MNAGRRSIDAIGAGLIATLALVLPAAAQTPAEPRYERAIAPAGAGPQRLAVDEHLLATTAAPFRVVRRGEIQIATDGLADLRLFAADGRSVPYLLVTLPEPSPQWVAGAVLPVPASKKTSGFEADFGQARTIDRIRMAGLPAPHLKRVKVEASGDRERWTLVIPEGTVFDLPEQGLRENTLAFQPGDYRYVRVIWDDTNSARVTLPATVSARQVSAGSSPPPAIVRAPSVERRPSEPGVSRFRVSLPAPSMPIVALDLEIGGGHLHRRAEVSESRFAGAEAAPVNLGQAMLSRVTREGVTAAALRIPIDSSQEAELELTIQDGENEPIDLRGVSLVLAELPWIYFEAPPGKIVARYGDPSQRRPVYDLEAVRRSIDLSKLPEARWDAGAPLTLTLTRTAGAPATLVPPAGTALDPASFKYVRPVESKAAGMLAALKLDAHAIANSSGATGAGARFADVRLLDSANRQVPYVLERRSEPLSLDLAFQPAAAEAASRLRSLGGRTQSVYSVTVPYPTLPQGTLVIETSSRLFSRTIRLGVQRPADRDHRDPWFDVRTVETWRFADETRPARPLTIPFRPAGEGAWTLLIEDGDNAPLPITAIRLLTPSHRLRFYLPEGSVRLAYGRDDLRAGQYDLALVASRVMGARAEEVTAAAPSAAAPTPAGTLVSPRTFWLMLGTAVLVLLGLIVRLLRSQKDA